MLTKRIIPCLDIKNNRVVKGINFENLLDAGDPVKNASHYNHTGADELVFLDISATNEKRKTLADLVEKIAQNISIPFSVGGGINSIQDILHLTRRGADKISINTSAVKKPEFITEAAMQFGSQCIIVAIDVKKSSQKDKWWVYIKGGTEKTEIDALEWIEKSASLGAGEILLTSMDKDGTKQGYDIALLKKASELINIPIIASGGAGKIEHFSEVLHYTDAALAASLFHFREIEIPHLKKQLFNEGFPIRMIE